MNIQQNARVDACKESVKNLVNEMRQQLKNVGLPHTDADVIGALATSVMLPDPATIMFSVECAIIAVSLVLKEMKEKEELREREEVCINA